MEITKKHDKTEIFETMPVPKALAVMAIPTIISQIITLIYNMADTYYRWWYIESILLDRHRFGTSWHRD